MCNYMGDNKAPLSLTKSNRCSTFDKLGSAEMRAWIIFNEFPSKVTKLSQLHVQQP